MEGKRKDKITNNNLDELLKKYSEINENAPSELHGKVLNRIIEMETQNKKESFLSRIKSSFRNYKLPAFAISLSVIMLLVISVGSVGVILSNNNNDDINNKVNIANNEKENKNRLAFTISAINNNDNDNDNDNDTFREISGIDNDNDNTSVSIGGYNYNVQNNEEDIIDALIDRDNLISVDGGSILMNFNSRDKILVAKDTTFNIDTNPEGDNIIINLEKGGMRFVSGNTKDADPSNPIRFSVETPAVKISSEEEVIFEIFVFDNGDVIVSVEKGTLDIKTIIEWNNEISFSDMKFLEENANETLTIEEGETEIFVMSDIADYSNYMNKNYKRLIKKYIRDE